MASDCDPSDGSSGDAVHPPVRWHRHRASPEPARRPLNSGRASLHRGVRRKEHDFDHEELAGAGDCRCSDGADSGAGARQPGRPDRRPAAVLQQEPGRALPDQGAAAVHPARPAHHRRQHHDPGRPQAGGRGELRRRLRPAPGSGRPGDTGRDQHELHPRLVQRRAARLRRLHGAHPDQPDHRRQRGPGLVRLRRDLAGPRARARALHLPHRPARGLRRLGDPHPRHLRHPQPQRDPARDQPVRQRDLRLRARRRRGGGGVAGHPRSDLQQLPRAARLPRRQPARRQALRALPQQADTGSRHRQHRRHEGDDPQDPHRRQPAQRAGRHSLPDHRLRPGGARLLRDPDAAGHAQLRPLPHRRDPRRLGLVHRAEPRLLRLLPRRHRLGDRRGPPDPAARRRQLRQLPHPRGRERVRHLGHRRPRRARQGASSQASTWRSPRSPAPLRAAPRPSTSRSPRTTARRWRTSPACAL